MQTLGKIIKTKSAIKHLMMRPSALQETDMRDPFLKKVKKKRFQSIQSSGTMDLLMRNTHSG